jgi:hypothetical protein
VPEAMHKVPTFQEALEESERQGQRRMLLRFLHHKFGDLPRAVVQLIEKTNDAQQLDAWMDQVFEAKSLADMRFTLG